MVCYAWVCAHATSQFVLKKDHTVLIFAAHSSVGFQTANTITNKQKPFTSKNATTLGVVCVKICYPRPPYSFRSHVLVINTYTKTKSCVGNNHYMCTCQLSICPGSLWFAHICLAINNMSGTSEQAAASQHQPVALLLAVLPGTTSMDLSEKTSGCWILLVLKFREINCDRICCRES